MITQAKPIPLRRQQRDFTRQRLVDAARELFVRNGTRATSIDDIAKAAEYLRAKGVKTMQGPIPVKEGPAAGQSILYFLTPWGMQMELISYPEGMAYEKGAKTTLWSTTDPTK